MNEENFEVTTDIQPILSKHKILVDCTLKSLQTPQGIKTYASKTLKRAIHDDVTISSVRLKKPHIISRIVAKLAKRPAQAKLYVTTEF